MKRTSSFDFRPPRRRSPGKGARGARRLRERRSGAVPAAVLLALLTAFGMQAGENRATPRPVMKAGCLEMAGMHLDPIAHSLSLPAEVNMDSGFIEYALVHESGKVHESLLRTSIPPHSIHLGLLLLRPPEIPAPSPGTLPPRLDIWVEPENKKSPRVRVEAWIHNTDRQAPMVEDSWWHTGSRIQNGGLTASRLGSVIAIMTDPDALIANPREGHEQDDIWMVNANTVPPAGTPVTVTMQYHDFKKSPDNSTKPKTLSPQPEEN